MISLWLHDHQVALVYSWSSHSSFCVDSFPKNMWFFFSLTYRPCSFATSTESRNYKVILGGIHSEQVVAFAFQFPKHIILTSLFLTMRNKYIDSFDLPHWRHGCTAGLTSFSYCSLSPCKSLGIVVVRITTAIMLGFESVKYKYLN